jgi:hypothetical protein
MGKACRRKPFRRNESEADFSFWAEESEPSKVERRWSDRSHLVRVEANLPQEQKISHALAELLKEEVPYDDASLSEYQLALDGIVIAWNLSLLASDDRAHVMGGMFKEGVPEASKESAFQEIERLMQRKQALFPEDNRQVLTWSVRMEGNHIRVQAGAKA